MFVPRKHLSSRTLLRSAGVGISLPLLDAMIPALTAQSKTAAAQLRLGCVYVPNGMFPKNWTPAQAGTEFEFTPLMKPLEPFREQVTVISGLAQKDVGTAHLTASSMWLNGVGPQSLDAANLREDTTMDQIIAAKIGADSALPSVELAIEDTSQKIGECDSGYSCLYMSTLSWRSPTQPLPTEVNPRIVFDRLFGEAGTVEQRLARLRYKRSILDSVTQEAGKIKGLLGAGDKVRLDEYIENIREVEKRIQRAEVQTERQAGSQSELPAPPVGIPQTYDEHAKILFDLMHLAYQGDITRVFTFMLAVEGSDLNYPQIGVSEGHHFLSHHGGNADSLKKYGQINTYHNSLFAYFLDKLKNTKDGDGTLLDHSMLLFGSGMGDGNVHQRQQLPLVVAGGATGKLKGGRHIACAPRTPMPNLLLSLMDKADIIMDKIGDSNGRVDL